MMIYTPYGLDYRQNAQCLDSARLQKNLFEAYTVFRLITAKNKVKKPFTSTIMNMWKDSPKQLLYYCQEMCKELKRRGIKSKLRNKVDSCSYIMNFRTSEAPAWMTSNAILSSHRGVLYRKDRKHYSQFKDYKQIRKLVYNYGYEPIVLDCLSNNEYVDSYTIGHRASQIVVDEAVAAGRRSNIDWGSLLRIGDNTDSNEVSALSWEDETARIREELERMRND